jgi:rhomboid protease GluP
MPNPDAQRYLPWATIVLIGLNLAMFAVELATGGDLMWGPKPIDMIDLGGNLGPLTLNGEPWRLFTSMFLHLGVLHLALNMWGIYSIGRVLEVAFGRVGYVVLYVVAGLAGSLVSAIRAQGVSVGASGALFGLFGAFVAFLIVHRDRLDPEARNQQIRSLGIVIVFNLLLGLQLKGIDMAAHVGGLFGGFLAAYALEWKRRGGRSRLVRIALVGVIGTAAVVGASFVVKPRLSNELSQAQDDVRAIMDVERVVLPRFQEITSDSKLDGPTQATLIETEVLPPWIKVQEAYKGSPGANHILLQYLAVRRDAWGLFAQGLRANDKATIQRGTERMQEADALVGKYNESIR